ncbi:MAG: ribosome small subunit-dependent GTPase A [Pseudomonadales bacterium]|nr:ribosome small subunit-dependent GTPase A [Pseudomonadales bacterium]MDP7146419.1 ribosome small subunit-dependent GTPase A [Pseudomonadales bacterium]MDP7358249.1 ribosome small subunit-dependent GTPase A [Pseudomonadales bacterium]MDP7597730.1 ribosome small subunit-dependent GTPase A [Pseudomonadales bacterium]HJN52384.1 ribosome small subunit-dependent GTPase A [Pseudomonadales bacterium]
MNLSELGWSDFFQEQCDSVGEKLIPARVARQDTTGYQLLAEQGELLGTLTGKLRYAAESRADLPAVGDWVLVQPLVNEPHKVVMHRLLARRSSFSRKEAGDKTDEQILAANIDTIFIVCGLDDNFNLHRIERYLLLAWDSGATPVVLLSKSDLCHDLDKKMEAVATIAMGVDIHPISGLTGDGIDNLRSYLGKGVTVTLLGSSGVGKSTIINSLLGFERFETSEVRGSDDKGRHTTTFREMAIMPDGGLIIDTPGMRELQVWADESSLSQSFDDVESLAERCRYGDCAHKNEPGCAVKDAIEAGTLDQDRLKSYLRFQRELKHLAAQQQVQARLDRKNRVKRFSKMMKRRPSKRDLS